MMKTCLTKRDDQEVSMVCIEQRGFRTSCDNYVLESSDKTVLGVASFLQSEKDVTDVEQLICITAVPASIQFSELGISKQVYECIRARLK